jgi:putative membrane protein
MAILTRIGLFLGILLLLALLLWQGAMEVFRLLVDSGWQLLWLPLVWLPNLLPSTQSWRYLFRPGEAPLFRHALAATWIGRAVNNTLPVASIGGEVVKARLLSIWGYNGIAASTSVIVDKTVQVIAVILWGLTGVVLLLSLSVDNGLALLALAGFGILALCALALFLLQRAGMFGFLAHHGSRMLKLEGREGFTLTAREVDAAVYESYLRRRRFITACLVKALGLAWQTLEVWLGCYLLGHPVSLAEAVMLKSLTATLSDIAFIIPNAYGIQEGLFIALGALAGLPPEVSLALSLALRIRDLILDPSGLLVLHHIESRRLLRPATADDAGYREQS